MKAIKQLLSRFQMQIRYLLFGVATTLVNFFCYRLLNELWNFSTVTASSLAWLISVLFAFFTNRRFVFESQTHTALARLKECLHFLISRLATGILDVVIMIIAVDFFRQPNLLWKMISNVLVIILNYLFGKFIFQKKKHHE